MTKKTLLSLFLATSILNAGWASDLGEELDRPSASAGAVSCEAQALLDHLKKYENSHFGLLNVYDGEHSSPSPLKIVTQEAWDTLVASGSLPAGLVEKMKERGVAKVGDVYWAARGDAPRTDVPAASAFFGKLRQNLTKGKTYILDGEASDNDLLAWAVADYARDFSKSAKKQSKMPLLVVGERDLTQVRQFANVTQQFRDLIATRNNQFVPKTGADLMEAMAAEFGASTTCFIGEKGLKDAFVTTWEVGKGSSQTPNVSLLEWTPSGVDPLFELDLVGKGVCFDTGGHNLKYIADSQERMYADKGGAIWQMMLARLIMENNLPIKLRLANAFVTNVPGKDAMMQSDIYKMRSGITVENRNTDAEGRLAMGGILDCFRAEGQAKLTFTAATLTGAALVAGGSNKALMFAYNGPVKSALMLGMRQAGDPVIRMKVDGRNLNLLKEGTDSDIKSMGPSYGGSATADMFLRHIAGEKTELVHFDIAASSAGSPGLTPGVNGMDAFGLRGAYLGLVNYIAHLQQQSASSSS